MNAQASADVARLANIARYQIGEMTEQLGDSSQSWGESARAWVDYAADLAWRASQAPMNAFEANVDRGAAMIWRAANAPADLAQELAPKADAAARALGQLAVDANRAGRKELGDVLTEMVNKLKEIVGVPFALGFLWVGLALLGGGYLLLGTAGGQALLGSALGVGTSSVRVIARGGTAYASGGASELVRVAR